MFDGAALTYGELDRAGKPARAPPAAEPGHRPDGASSASACRGRWRWSPACSAILKAGGAYVPIEPDFPDARAAYMLKDAARRSCLTVSQCLPLLAKHGVDAVALRRADLDRLESRATAAERGGRSGPDDLAYVHLHLRLDRPAQGGDDPASARSSTACSGCRRRYGLGRRRPGAAEDAVQLRRLGVGVLLAAADRRPVWSSPSPSGTRTSRYLARPDRAASGSPSLHFVPSMLQMFLDEDLRACDVAAPGLLQRRGAARRSCAGALQRAARGELHNLYGPTEAAIDVTFWDCSPGPRPCPACRSAGRSPTPQIYVARRAAASRRRSACRASCYIGGASSRAGYLNRPELTARAVRPRPVRAEPGARLYRTGDLARCRRDGDDRVPRPHRFQVKLRGFGSSWARSSRCCAWRREWPRRPSSSTASATRTTGWPPTSFPRARRRPWTSGRRRVHRQETAELHGAGDHPGDPGAAADAERQARPQAPSRAQRRHGQGRRAGDGGDPGERDRARAAHRLAQVPEVRRGDGERRLLRAGGALDPRHPGDQQRQRPVSPQRAGADPVREPHRPAAGPGPQRVRGRGVARRIGDGHGDPGELPAPPPAGARPGERGGDRSVSQAAPRRSGDRAVRRHSAAARLGAGSGRRRARRPRRRPLRPRTLPPRTADRRRSSRSTCGTTWSWRRPAPRSTTPAGTGRGTATRSRGCATRPAGASRATRGR